MKPNTTNTSGASILLGDLPYPYSLPLRQERFNRVAMQYLRWRQEDLEEEARETWRDVRLPEANIMPATEKDIADLTPDERWLIEEYVEVEVNGTRSFDRISEFGAIDYYSSEQDTLRIRGVLYYSMGYMAATVATGKGKSISRAICPSTGDDFDICSIAEQCKTPPKAVQRLVNSIVDLQTKFMEGGVPILAD